MSPWREWKMAESILHFQNGVKAVGPLIHVIEAAPALAELERLKKENEELRSSVRGLEFELNSAEVDKKELKAENELIANSWRKENDIDKEQIKELKAQLASDAAMSSDLTQSLENMETLARDKTREVEHLKKELDDLQKLYWGQEKGLESAEIALAEAREVIEKFAEAPITYADMERARAWLKKNKAEG